MHSVWLLFSIFPAVLSENLSERALDQKYHDCRSCQEPVIDQSNCPESFYDCDENEPLRAAVLTASDECRCQSITCANRGWRLAVNGSIVDKVRCEGRNWVIGPESLAPSMICAKYNPLATTTTTQPPPVCKPPPADIKCETAVYAGTSFTAACFEGLRPYCVGDSVLITQRTLSSDMSTVYTTLEEQSFQCDQEDGFYPTVVFGKPMFIDQLSCMTCPHMSGDAETTFTGAHEPATYSSCLVKCKESSYVLFGKTSEGFKKVDRGVAYYTYSVVESSSYFVNSAGHKFENDFYCAAVEPPVCKPPPADIKCETAVYPSTPFTETCFEGLRPYCIGDSVLVTLWTIPNDPQTEIYTTVEHADDCQQDARLYPIVVLGTPFNIEQLSCMPCPHMSGDAPTTFTEDHEPAVYDSCSVKCSENTFTLYGKTSEGFKKADRGIAYYTYPSEGTGTFFIDSAGLKFENDFYCAAVEPPVCKPPPADIKCETAVYPSTPFTAACFEGLLPYCVGDAVIVAMKFITTLQKPVYLAPKISACDQEGRAYPMNLFGEPPNTDQVSCMACPHMSGDAPTTFTQAHEPATFENCLVNCKGSSNKLYGKTKEGFKQVNRGHAYYAYPIEGSDTFFVDSEGLIFETDFYCDSVTASG